MFKRLIGYDVCLNIEYGFRVNDGYSIKGELVNGEEGNLISCEVYEVGVKVRVS